jgi:hypothetical protein
LKAKKYIKKYGMKIWAIVFLIVEFYIKNFIEETDGKNAFFTKEYEALKIMVITILLVINIISMLKKNINGKKFHIKIVIIIYIILLTVLLNFSLSISIKNIPPIGRDMIEGKYVTSLKLTENNEITEKWMKTRYYVGGITSDGEEITFEVSGTTYYDIVMIRKVKEVDIVYWKYSKTLHSWTDATK